jgi:phospholipid/cholesterol/gamma-HCH transport system substrate-binding protein
VKLRLLYGAIAVIVIVAAVLFLNRSYSGYSARVILADSGGLQSGSNVTVDGVTVGQVASLGLDAHDRAVAVVHLNKTAAPLGTGATALVQIDGFFGERELSLTRGDYKAHPQPSGTTIPVSASGVSVRLDDVVDALNMDAQGALRTFLDEQGTALVGRGHDLASVLSALPPSLSGLQQLMSQLSANQRALGALVDHSDRVVAAVAAQRHPLGQMINSANGALSALASRRTQLGETVRTAPATLRQAQSTLATLQGAAIPLAPAADGLRATAPSLTAALKQIPAFANAAVPTLNTIAAVAPALQRLGDEATPVVRSLAPMTRQLSDYTTQALSPITTMLGPAGGAANVFGEMEGWARSTSGYDASSHIFRFGATVGPSTFAQLLADFGASGLTPQRRAAATPAASAGEPTSATAPAGAPTSANAPAPGATAAPSSPAGQPVGTASGGTQSTPPATTAAAAPLATAASSLQSLLGYLLKR